MNIIMKNKIKTMIIFTIFWGTIFVIPFSVFPVQAQAEVVFIINDSTDISSLTKAQVKEIFLGVEVKWQNGNKIMLATLKDVPIHKEFVSIYTAKNTTQFMRYWKRMVFIGKRSMPRIFKTENELIGYVANTQGSIGYISSIAEHDGVKVIEISD